MEINKSYYLLFFVILILYVFDVVIFKSANYLTLQEQAVDRSAPGYVQRGV